MEIVTAIFDAIGAIVTGAVNVFVGIFANDGIVSVFWNATDNTLSILGVLALIAFGFGLVRWGFGFVLKMLRMKG
jgi:hypothetical protein